MGKKTDFKTDAVGDVRRVRDAQHQALTGQPWEARVAFFRDRAAKLSDSLREGERSDARGPAV